MAMKRWKRALLITLGVVLVLLIVAVGIALSFAGGIVTKAVNTAGPSVLGVKTHLDGATIRPLRGDVELRGLFVGNPEGFSSPSLLTADRIKVGANVRAFLKNNVHIREVTLNAPEFTFEYTRDGSNIERLLERLEKGEAEQKEKEKKEPAQFQIDLIQVTGAKVNVVVLDKTVPLTLGGVTLRNVNGSPTHVIRELVLSVAKDVQSAVAATEVAGAISDLGKAAEAGVKKAASGVQEGVKNVGDTLKKTGEGVKKLFGN